MGDTWRGTLIGYTANSSNGIERPNCTGTNIKDACYKALQRWPHFIRFESTNHRVHAGAPRPNPATLGDVMPDAVTEQLSVYKHHPVIGEDIRGRLREELQREELQRLEKERNGNNSRMDKQPQKQSDASDSSQWPTTQMSNYDIILSIAPQLPKAFTLDNVIDRLQAARYFKLAQNRKAIQNVISYGIVKGVYGRVPGVKKGIYEVSAAIRNGAPIPTEQSPKAKGGNGTNHSTAIADTIKVPTSVAPAAKAEPSPVVKNDIDRYAALMATIVMVSPEDEKKLENALEAVMEVQDIISRVLGTIAMRNHITQALRQEATNAIKS